MCPCRRLASDWRGHLLETPEEETGGEEVCLSCWGGGFGGVRFLMQINKIFDLTVELYRKVKNLIFQISLNQLDEIIFFIKQRRSVLFSSICA